ncbi:MAG: 3-phosphoshikimate 1-carboxyvinyltransferase [Flavobacteriaceae bacterium]|nr:3-phosphoshikimate 1-carboxyvinyltransferase [Flavobacteriaceae bacterium]
MKANLSYDPLKKDNFKNTTIEISGSKSESNRLLILEQYFKNLQIENVSNCNDTVVIQKALKSQKNTIDIHHAGTAMRFLTAFFSAKEGKEIILTGSQRMKERPIKILVDALKQLGADIQYLENDGFPPLLIKGKKLNKNEVTLNANVSSQYISALLLLAPVFKDGLTLNLQGEITSRPYLDMTITLLKKLEFNCKFEGNEIKIDAIQEINNTKIIVEADWSSASYFYSIVALSENKKITLRSFQKNSLQGDSKLSEIYENFGVQTIFNDSTNEITISKTKVDQLTKVSLDLSDAPDIAQTIAVTCFGLNISCTLTGLHTLKIKETDRLQALKVELEKLGAEVIITNDSLKLFTSLHIKPNVLIETYEDHRMAMAFAPLALLSNISIENPEVVNKSYPNFWKDLEKTGVLIDYK